MAESRNAYWEGINPAQFARLFSAAVIREMAAAGRSATFARIVAESGIADSIDENGIVRDLYCAAFRELKMRHRNEHVYKTAIATKILIGRHSLKTAAMLTEFRVGVNKADVVILNGTSTAYEVKSDRDDLSRLRSQVEAYLKVFARVCVLGTAVHSDAILQSTPSEVGVLQLTTRGHISTIRAPIEDADRTEPASIFEVLQLGEALQVLALMKVSIPEVPNTRRFVALKELFVRLEPRKVHDAFVTVLRASRGHADIADTIRTFPPSILALVLATRINAMERTRLLSALATPVADAVRWS